MREADGGEMESLRKVVAERGPGAYVVTVSDDQRPHAVYVPVAWEGQGLVAAVGARTAANAAARPGVTILYPPRGAGDYSFIVDGTAAVAPIPGGHRLAVAPARAVFHRPGPASEPARSSCSADCIPVLEPEGRGGAAG